MNISLRLAELLGEKANERGLLAHIEEECGIERHTVSSWLKNKTKYVSLEALGRLADYLVKYHNIDRSTLPGALFRRDPERFWDALVNCRNLEFCFGTRFSNEWAGSEYVMSSDALLLNRMLSEITHKLYRPDDRASAGKKDNSAGKKDNQVNTGDRATPEGKDIPVTAHPFYPAIHLLDGPARRMTAETPGEDWDKARAGAEKLYDEFRKKPTSALVALGSIKVNLVVELMLANTFGATPFVSQDNVAKPRNRRCPIMFRYRDDDPQPPACCGGMRLAARTAAPLFGMYCETEKGDWEGFAWDDKSRDVGFLFYAYRPNIAQVEVACGGFSARATMCLTRKLGDIAAELGEPQFTSDSARVGLYLIEFIFDPNDPNPIPYRDERKFEYKVIPLDEKVLRRRL